MLVSQYHLTLLTSGNKYIFELKYTLKTHDREEVIEHHISEDMPIISTHKLQVRTSRGVTRDNIQQKTQNHVFAHSHTHRHAGRWTHPDPHEAVSEHNPRQQEDKGLVTTEERGHVCCVDLPEGLQVKVVGEDPQQAKGRNLGEKHLGCQSIVPEKPTALPVRRQNAEQSKHIMFTADKSYEDFNQCVQ